MSSLSKTIYVFLALVIFPCLLSAYDKVSIYVSAHQDDWQLFMGVNAYDDIITSNDSSRVVFIYVTAGDYSDCINASDTNPVPYYLSREQGAKNSVQLAADSHKKHFTWRNDTVSINNHLVIRSAYNSTTSYFLRLADGGRDGQRNISLKNFHRNRFNSNYSIDSLTYYTGWKDLVKTCNALLESEIKNADEVWMHLLDTNETVNPDDHSDHYESALLFYEVNANKKWNVLLHEGYSSGKDNRVANLKETDVVKESGLFAAYVQAMIDNGYPSIWNGDYLRFCDNNYFRTASEEKTEETGNPETVIAIFALLVLSISLLFYYILKKK